MTTENTQQDQLMTQNIRNTTSRATQLFLETLEKHDKGNLYQIALAEFEKGLFTTMYDFLKGNQSKIAQLSGLNRATVRTKLKRYDLIS